MKPTPTSPESPSVDILAFGAHPDDIEFGCGAIIAKETSAGRSAHFVICSHGEAATHGTPAERTKESQTAATLLGASLEFLDLDGDAHLELRTTHAIALARIIRQHRPRILLAPTTTPNQHPDHARLGQLVRDAARLARYGGLEELQPLPPHSINALLFYAITPDAELAPEHSILIDISVPTILTAWTAAMEAHTSQNATRNYIDLQLTRARLHGHRAGVTHALPLYPNDPLILDSLATLKGARHF
jgi:N-acetylglucosamine malate deacetylase 1